MTAEPVSSNTRMMKGMRAEAETPVAVQHALDARALSRHTDAHTHRFEVSAEQMNPWCRIPGSPFADGLLLLPNPPDHDWPGVSYEPIRTEGADAITFLFVSPARPEHGNRLLVRVGAQTVAGEPLASS